MRNLPNLYTTFHPGSTIINGTPGSLVETLRTTLVTGTSKVSFTNIKVLNGVATLDAPADNKTYFNGSRIQIEGCAEPLLNGIWEIDSHQVRTFSFLTTVADGTYGGSILVNQPGAGWQILFSGTNEAVFISGNLDTLGICIKVIDINAYYATIELYENMTSLTVGVNKFENAILGTTRVIRINKSGFATATSVNYWIMADNTSFHISIDRTDSGTVTPTLDIFAGGFITSFGQLETFDSEDKRNFYFSSQPILASNTTGTYEAVTAYQIGSFLSETPSNSNCNGVILLSGQVKSKGWQRLALLSTLFPYTNLARKSGGVTRFGMSSRAKNNYLLTDYAAMTFDPVSTTSLNDPRFCGYLAETKFANQVLVGNVKNFSKITVGGKKYICLPTNHDTAYRPSNNYTPSNFGIVPFLISEKWGD